MVRGTALVAGVLLWTARTAAAQELRLELAHLCDQKGCVDHLVELLKPLEWIAETATFAGPEKPAAQLRIAPGATPDLQLLRESLGREGVVVTGLGLASGGGTLDHKLLVVDFATAGEPPGCAECRQAMVDGAAALEWVEKAEFQLDRLVVTLRPVESLDAVELLDALERSGHVAVSLLIADRGGPLPPRPRAPAPCAPDPQPKTGGTQADALIQLEFAHLCPGRGARSLVACLNELPWASRTAVLPEYPGAVAADQWQLGATAAVAVAERQWADVADLVRRVRAGGQAVSAVHLTRFGTVRIRPTFAFLCGETVEIKEGDEARTIRPPTSTARQAIEGAVGRMPWLADARYTEAGTKPDFSLGEPELQIEFMLDPAQSIEIGGLVAALVGGGFPPKALRVARMAAGVPFGFPIPGDVELVDAGGAKHASGGLQQPGRPLVLVFFPLQAKYKESKEEKTYQAAPAHFARLVEVAATYADRADFAAVSSRAQDAAADVARFWQEAGMPFPLFRDPEQKLAAALAVGIDDPPPHVFVLDAAGALRYAGEFADGWIEPAATQRVYLAEALDGVLAEKYAENGAVFYNSKPCFCSAPTCKCPKCRCGGPCRCNSSTGAG